ncbi:MAG: hypothetical protein IH626_11890 [Rhodospirillales bacterium]|nr:hypothetical protein [Rhodospirillales bacterium]
MLIDTGQGRKSKKNGRSQGRPSLTGRLEETWAKSGKKDNFCLPMDDDSLLLLT